MKLKEFEWEVSYRKSDHVVARKIADETILVPISGDLANMERIFTVNEVGAFIWNSLDGIRTLKEIRLEMLNEFDVEEDHLDSDIFDFIYQLKKVDLILES